MTPRRVYLVVEAEPTEIQVAYDSRRQAERHVAELSVRHVGVWVQPIMVYEQGDYPVVAEWWQFTSYVSNATNLVKRSDIACISHWSYEPPIKPGSKITPGSSFCTVNTVGQEYEDTRSQHEVEVRRIGGVSL